MRFESRAKIGDSGVNVGRKRVASDRRAHRCDHAVDKVHERGLSSKESVEGGMVDIPLGDRQQFEHVAATVVELRSRFVSDMSAHASRWLAQIPKAFARDRKSNRKLPVGERRDRRVESTEFIEHGTSYERGW